MQNKLSNEDLRIMEMLTTEAGVLNDMMIETTDDEVREQLAQEKHLLIARVNRILGNGTTVINNDLNTD